MIAKSGLAMISIAALGIGGALAQQTAPPPGQPPAGQQASVSAEQAVQIARNEGMVNVEEVDRDNGHWEVEGRDAQGREIEVKIDLRTGAVLKVERD